MLFFSSMKCDLVAHLLLDGSEQGGFQHLGLPLVRSVEEPEQF
jgi:hypothetical protein